MHVMVQEHLKTIGLFMNNSFKVVINSIFLCAIAWWTCMQNLGAWKMLGDCSTRMSMNNLLSLE
jgi:hypothetical protein